MSGECELKADKSNPLTEKNQQNILGILTGGLCLTIPDSGGLLSRGLLSGGLCPFPIRKIIFYLLLRKIIIQGACCAKMNGSYFYTAISYKLYILVVD